MKKVLILFVLGLPMLGLGQQIAFDIIEDNPEANHNRFVSAEFLGAEIGGKYQINVITLGGNTLWQLNDQLGFDGALRIKVAADDRVPFSMSLEGGAFKSFGNPKKKVKDTKVRIGGEFVEYANQRGYSEKFVVTPATVYEQPALRGGIYFFKKANGPVPQPYTIGGVYGGWMKTQSTNFKIQLRDTKDNTLNKGVIEATGVAKIYADLLLTPLINIDYNNPADEIDLKLIHMLGARVGYLFYKDGSRALDKIMFGSELGVRPLEGFYLNVIVGYTLFRG